MQLNLPNEVEFHYRDYHHVLIEPGPTAYDWMMTERLKSWLSMNLLKVFVHHFCGDSGTDSPITTFRFKSTADAQYFYDHWFPQRHQLAVDNQ